MKLELLDVCKKFGSETILDSIGCQFLPGELTALVGTNGAGKTTLLKLMATLYLPTAGKLMMDGELLHRDRLDLRARLHMLPDMPFFLRRTAIDHICMSATLYDRPIAGLKEQIVDWLKQFDMLESAEKNISTLSRGQKYKAAFIGLMAANPELWILDEPFAAGVDPTGISAIKRCVNKALGAGRTIIYSTQIVELAESFSDRVLLLHDGNIKADIPSAELNRSEDKHGLAQMFEHLRLAK